MTNTEIDTTTFGRYIRSLRLYGRGPAGARNQRVVAAEAGIDVVALSKMESDRIVPPPRDIVARLIVVLDGDEALALRLRQDWQPAPPDPPGFAIACGPSGCRVQRVGGETT